MAVELVLHREQMEAAAASRTCRFRLQPEAAVVAVTAPERLETDGLVVVVVAQTGTPDALAVQAQVDKAARVEMQELMAAPIEVLVAAANRRSARTETHLPERAATATHSTALHMRAAAVAEQWDRMCLLLSELVEVGKADDWR